MNFKIRFDQSRDHTTKSNCDLVVLSHDKHFSSCQQLIGALQNFTVMILFKDAKSRTKAYQNLNLLGGGGGGGEKGGKRGGGGGDSFTTFFFKKKKKKKKKE